MKRIIYLFILTISMAVAACSSDDPQSPTPPVYPDRGELLQIEIKQQPEQLVYPLHSTEPINLKGLIVEGHYSDGKNYPITVKPEHIFGFSTEKENDHLPVTIRIEGKEAVFYVQVVSDVLNQVTDDGTDTYTVASHIRTIGPNAFKNTHFTTIILNEGLVRIGKQAFSGTPVQKINFPSSLKEIGEQAFYLCPQLKDIDLSQTQVVTIKEHTFQGASLRSIELPATLTGISYQAFMRTTNLQGIVIPESVDSICLEAFRESGIQHAVLPNNIHRIEKRAFMLCKELTTVTCTAGPATFTKGVIENNLFQGCPKIQELSYPESTEIIQMNQLSENPSLTLLRLPKNLNLVSFNAFGNSQSIQRIEIAATTPPSLDLYSLPKVDKIHEIVVPQGCAAIYVADEKWKPYQKIIID